MALQTSGAISLNDIHIEAGGSSGTSVSINDADVRGLINKASGATMSFNEWYGATAETVLTSAGAVNGQNQRQEITVSSFISSGGQLRIPSDIWVWSNSTSTAALRIDIPCTIVNEGKIIGRGGNASMGVGGPAIEIVSGVTGVTITNASGAYIAGGGGGGQTVRGGGGGGAGGGSGARGLYDGRNGGGGGSLSARGGNGGNNYTSGANGGEAGGGGGGYSAAGSGNHDTGGGGGGGRILPGVATGGTVGRQGSGGQNGTGGTGGAGGQAGGNGTGAAGWAAGKGGGGWGASGGGGSAAGAAIKDNGQSYTLNNSGTIYGAT